MAQADRLLAGLPDAILRAAPSGEVIGWHGGAERLLGWSAGEALGENISRLLQPRLPSGEDWSLPEQPVAGRSENSSHSSDTHWISEQELLVKAKGGSDVWVGLTYGFYSGDAGELEMVAALRDIRHRKGVDIAKSDVISSVAHELRSPLTSIKGFAATLVKRWDRFDDDRRRQILGTIEADADRVTRLIAELLDLSRLEEGRLQLRKQPVQIPTIAERIIGHMKERSGRHSLTCGFSNPFPTVMADADKVEQVLTNLVENAVKYTEEGEVRISGVANESEVRVTVTDQGAGIPESHRHNVFRKFFRRADVTTSSVPLPPGSGLGLYISKGLIEAHGGKIWVEDAPGGGALFAFTLPLN